MKNRILAEMEFASIISGAQANTQTGAELINRYKSYVMAHDINHAVVNGFIREASKLNYDNGIMETLNKVSAYVNANKTSWALASACEQLNADNSSYNYINRNFAVKQVEKLLEMNEEDVVKYIKAGALKNVMFCEAFRNIAKQVYKDTPLVESTADYTRITPVSMVESSNNNTYFVIEGNLFKIDDNGVVSEAKANEVSNTFKNVNQLLESSQSKVYSDLVSIETPNATYEITEANMVKKIGKEGTYEMTVEQLRENNRLVLMTCNPTKRHQMASLLEGIALISENYDRIANLDNAAVYVTNNDRFLVIESETNLYSTLLKSTRHPKWTINENVVDALSFIKTKTNTSLNDIYKTNIDECIEKMADDEKQMVAENLKNQTHQNYRERIELLTEQFKNDPVKLAVLSKLANDLNNLK
jgi:23S rRNA maturation mini-RNase III